MKTLLRLLEVKHLDVDGSVIWEDKNINNILHIEGQEFLLELAFAGLEVPATYYLGLDNRTTLAASDTMGTITTEPLGSGYLRQAVLSSGEFDFNLTDDGDVFAQSPIITFSATGGSWGPVNNVFLTTEEDSTGFLIASIRLSNQASLVSGQQITMAFGLGLKNC